MRSTYLIFWKLFIIITIIGVILGGDILVKKHLSNTTSEFVSKLEELKEKTVEGKESDDRKEAKDTIKKVENKWKEISKIWSTVIVHQEVDNIEQAIIRAKSYINDGKLEDAIPEIETAIFFAEHINQREQFKLKNIF